MISSLLRAAGRILPTVMIFAVPLPAAQAGGSHVVSVGATVLSKNQCKFTNGGPTVLSFGTIDPSSPATQTAVATTTFRCTGSSATATYSISSDDGLYETGANAPRMRHSVDLTRFLPYTIDLPQSGSAPKNVVQTLTVTGTVLPGDFQNALGGSYFDTVTLTIVP